MKNQKLARKSVEIMVAEVLQYYKERGFDVKVFSRPPTVKYPYFTINYDKKTLRIFANRKDHKEVLNYKLIDYMVKESFPPRLRKRFTSQKS